MRMLILILYILLSLLFGGRLDFAEELRQSYSDFCISECPESERFTEFAVNKDICLTSAQSSSLFGNSNSNNVSVRTTSSGRNSNHRQMHTSFLSGGKFINIISTHPFLNSVFFMLSGTRTTGSYLFVICRLRL